MADSPTAFEEALPPYVRDLPSYQQAKYYVVPIPPFRGRRTTYNSSDPRASIPLQDNPEFPFHLAHDAHMYLRFHEVDGGTDLILPSGGTKSAPLYTVRWSSSRMLSKRYNLYLFRNNDRKLDWYDINKPVAFARIHTKFRYLDFEFDRSDGTKVTMNGFTHHDMYDNDSFLWPAAMKDSQRYTWTFREDWEMGETPWLYSRLCRVGKDNKAPREEQSIVDVMIWSEGGSFYDERSYFRIPMREILGAGQQREAQLQRMEEIVMVAMGFCAGKMRFAYNARA